MGNRLNRPDSFLHFLFPHNLLVMPANYFHVFTVIDLVWLIVAVSVGSFTIKNDALIEFSSDKRTV